MTKTLCNLKQKITVFALLLLGLTFSTSIATAIPNVETVDEVTVQLPTITGAKKINPTTISVKLSDSNVMAFDFYGDNIFRLFQDTTGGVIRKPEAKPEATIMVEQPREAVSKLELTEEGGVITIKTSKIALQLDKKTTLFKVVNLETGRVVVEEIAPILFEKEKVTLTLKECDEEYFYGGGVQNGRFSHKGKSIFIENENSWTDGGVASPTPFYWSTNGYGMMWHTFKKGKYNFGSEAKGEVTLYHEENYLDVFFMVSDGAVALLNDFYQLTGEPIFLPKFSLYVGHLNAYNRDYWTENEKGILFEDGKRYKEGKEDSISIKESLNGELNNYQFSARAVIDRYKNANMPLGWLLANDGYGAGYGQTTTVDGNIENLRLLADYAQDNGVEIGLWTQSDLHPKKDVSVLLQRDIVKEVRDAGVRVLKTDVAWVGAGYSFGLNGVTDVAQIMTYYGENSRPFIISLDGWAGTQRYAGIWSGDQTGGDWEYIRFHIPTYIGSGLSGQPNICSDMDGIFGGNNVPVNVRDYQWKTFTLMQLNMDGWGANPKYPQALGEPAASINRWYLKMKSEITPYAYSVSEEAIYGKPVMRAMFLEYPNKYTYGKATQYQYMFGPNFLVAPVYQETQADTLGNDMRNDIYLPEGTWIDYFTGETYEGNCIINNFDTPLWKLPVFVKNGAIIPMANPNNNVTEINKALRIYEIYPYKSSSFTEYDDDGVTEKYRFGRKVTTLIESNVDDKNRVTVTVHPTKGDFNGFESEKATEFRVNVTAKPKKISAKVGKSKVKLTEVATMDEFTAGENVYFYNSAPNLNQFATEGSEFAKEVITKNPQVLVKLAASDITEATTTLKIDGFVFEPANRIRVTYGALTAPKAEITDENTQPYTLKPTWAKVENADYYEIMFNDMLYTTIKNTELLFLDLVHETPYTFKVRSVNKDGVSDWTEVSATTKANPLEFAIQGITGETSVPNQGGQGTDRLFNHEENDAWHTKWGETAVPFDLTIDLKSVNKLDKFHYVPRNPSGNGTLLEGAISYSMDNENWIEADTFVWEANGDVKVYTFADQPMARFIKLDITKASGNYGSGQELYVFRVPNSSSYLQGDINSDKKVDRNDLVSYMNYTGLRKGDSDFEGYISIGDINQNELIDAYDISLVAVELDGGIKDIDTLAIDGGIKLSADKKSYSKGETITITVTGDKLQAVNALSFAMPYNTEDYEYVGIEAIATKGMENLTYDRLHTSGVKALYPTFVNLGEKPSLNGDSELFVIKFKAKRNLKFNLEAIDGILVDDKLKTIKL